MPAATFSAISFSSLPPMSGTFTLISSSTTSVVPVPRGSSRIVPLALVSDSGISLAVLAGILAVIGWICLDRMIGIAMIAMVLPFVLIADWIARSYGSGTAWLVFAVFFIGGWAFQLLGHVWEGRRPALADNLFQAFIGPMFIMAEILMALGLKRELKTVIEH